MQITIDSRGRIPIYAGAKRVGYRSAAQTYRRLTGNRIKWATLQALLKEDRGLAVQLVAAAYTEPAKARGGVTLAEWCDSFLERKLDEGAKPATLKNYRRTAEVLVAVLGDVPIAHLGVEAGVRLRRELIKTYAPSTSRLIITQAKAIADASPDTADNPFAGLTVHGPPVRERVYEVDAAEVRAVVNSLLDQGDTDRAALLALCRFAGCRRAEALAVETRHLDGQRRAVCVQNLKTSRHATPTRTVPLGDWAYRTIRRCADGRSGRVCRLTIDQAGHVKRALGLPWSLQALRRAWSGDAIRAASLPEYVEASGHSAGVALRHYNSAQVGRDDSLRIG